MVDVPLVFGLSAGWLMHQFTRHHDDYSRYLVLKQNKKSTTSGAEQDEVNLFFI